MYKAIQTELVRIHTTTDEGEDEDINPKGEHQHFRRRLTQLSEEGEMSEEEEKLPSPPLVKKPGKYLCYNLTAIVIRCCSITY